MIDNVGEMIKRTFDAANEALASQNYVNPRTDEETRQLIHRLVFEGASALTTQEFYEINYICKTEIRWLAEKIWLTRELLKQEGLRDVDED